jgi:hypothetical protein
MYRVAYRNFGDHESLVANHSVTVGSQSAIRWYELRNPGGTPVVYQQGSYAPDSNYRWMGSIGMDRLGDIALGYSVAGGITAASVLILWMIVLSGIRTNICRPTETSTGVPG